MRTIRVCSAHSVISAMTVLYCMVHGMGWGVGWAARTYMYVSHGDISATTVMYSFGMGSEVGPAQFSTHSPPSGSTRKHNPGLLVLFLTCRMQNAFASMLPLCTVNRLDKFSAVPLHLLVPHGTAFINGFVVTTDACEQWKHWKKIKGQEILPRPCITRPDLLPPKNLSAFTNPVLETHS